MSACFEQKLDLLGLQAVNGKTNFTSGKIQWNAFDALQFSFLSLYKLDINEDFTNSTLRRALLFGSDQNE